MATKKTAKKPVEHDAAATTTKEPRAAQARPKRAQGAAAAEEGLGAKESRPAATGAKGATRRKRARSAAEAEEKLGAQEAREDGKRAEQATAKGAGRRKKEAAPEPAQEQASEQLPGEPVAQPAAKKKASRKRARPATPSPAADDTPWNPRVTLRWDDEEQPAWTGTLDELVEANTLDEGGDGWVQDLRGSLRQSGQHQGGGGAAPGYTISVVEPEPAEPDPDEVRARTLASVPGPPTSTEPVNVTSATLLDAATGYVATIEAEGASDSTVSGYRRELQVALGHFGEGTLLCALTPRKVQNYFESDAVMVARNGEPKAEPSWQRTRRVLRLALVWAQEQGLVEEAPLPEKRRASKKQQGASAAS